MIKVTNKRFNTIRKSIATICKFNRTVGEGEFGLKVMDYTLGTESFGRKEMDSLGDISSCYVAPKFLDRIFYNDIFNTYGEEMMLVYETLVDYVIEDVDYTIEVLKIAHLSPNLLVSQEIIELAKRHAQQEIDESVANDFSSYVNMDLESILD